MRRDIEIAERIAARDAADEFSEATAFDFNCPPVRVEYERFLILLASSGGPDRFHALEVRKHQGVEAAVRYLERCNITPEANDRERDATAEVHETFHRLQRIDRPRRDALYR